MRSSSSSKIVIGLAAVLVLVYVGSLLFDPSQTNLVIWPREWNVDPRRLVPFAVSLALYLLMGHLIYQRATSEMSRRKTAFVLAAVFIAGLALQIAATSVPETYPLRGILHRQYSSFTGGYFTVGARIDDLGEYLAGYAQNMISYPTHPQHHPPGLPLIFWAGTKLAALVPGITSAIAPGLRPLACFDEAPGALDDAQIVSGLLGAGLELCIATAVIVPLFFFVRRLSNARAAALAVILYPLTACVLMWVGRFDHAYPIFAMCGLWLCEHILGSSKSQHSPQHPLEAPSSGRPLAGVGYALAMGAMLGVATFFTFGNLQIVLVCGVYFIARAVQKEGMSKWRLRVGQGLVMAAAFAAFWLIWIVVFRLDAAAIYRYATGQHFTLDRPYWPWVVWQPWDICTFIGLPISVIAVLTMWKRQPALVAALVGPLLFMCVFHILRDETGRTAMYLAPLAVALAAMYVEQQTTAIRAAALGLLALQVFVMVSLIRVPGYGVDPDTVGDAVVPADATAANIRFGDNGELRLLGYQIKDTHQPGDFSGVTLYWKLDSTAPVTTSYKVFLHIADTLDDQTRIVNRDWKPLNWTLPTTCWRPGMIVRDAYDFIVDPNSAPGQYVALVGLYEESTNRRAFVHTADVARNGAVMLPTRIQVVR